MQEGKKAKSQTSAGKTDKKPSAASAKGKGKVGKGSEKRTDEADTAEEERSGDDDGETRMDEGIESVKAKVTKPVKAQQKIPKSKAIDNKDDVKPDKAKLDQSKQNKASL